MNEKGRELIHIGMSSTNISIWNEYRRLVEEIFSYFDRDFDKYNQMSLPILHLMSHSIEIGLKENIFELKKIFPEHNPKTNLKTDCEIEKSHDCWELTKIFKSFINHAFKILTAIPKDEKQPFREKIIFLNEFISEVNPKTTTYRYEYSIRPNRIKERSLDWQKKIKILDVFESFKEAQIVLLHTIDLYHLYFDFKLLKVLKPDYERGIGKVAYRKDKYHINQTTGTKTSDIVRFLEKYKKEGSLIYNQSDNEKLIETKIPNKIFFHTKWGMYLELVEVEGYHFLPVITKEQAEILKYELES
ncbi:hypothetical protein [Mongoliitalea daihaiensis]|uniref:hypothetical protein n=1 Tax=Mongoliitalea daihaiensis TaxID=2782006 RepID=UPI001F2A2ABF|nr:hypothetical protein [Mongoliitalea daihaiensis]UJP65125.1 hypothetical protein IPZ59_00330 [Mongoliitalea daihaiensis]